MSRDFDCVDTIVETKDPVANKKLAKYNIRDCKLVLMLQTKLQVLLGLIQLSEISLTPLQDVIYRGVSYRIMNMFSKRAHDAGFYLNNARIAHIKEFEASQKFGGSVGNKRRRVGARTDEVKDDENLQALAGIISSGGNPVQKKKDAKFQGAHCFTVVKAVHTDNIIGVDFASLYPSIIRRYNIDPTLLVLKQNAVLSVSTTKRQLTDGKPEDFATFAKSKAQKRRSLNYSRILL